MDHEMDRITWKEQVPFHSACYVIAVQYADGQWRFFDQWAEEVQWYSRPASPILLRRLEAELARRPWTVNTALSVVVQQEPLSDIPPYNRRDGREASQWGARASAVQSLLALSQR
jgi:hypothetical protein